MNNQKSKKILMVIAPEQFRDEELNQPMEIFKKKGAIVTIASTSLGEAKGMFGSKVKVDKLISSVNYNDYDAIVVVGGMGSPDYLWNDSNLKNLIINANKSCKIIGAICLSGVVLARAGILKGIEATVYRTTESLKEYSQYGAKYNPKNVIKSGNIITADGPASARDFGNAIANALI
jgi:protease I